MRARLGALLQHADRQFATGFDRALAQVDRGGPAGGAGAAARAGRLRNPPPAPPRDAGTIRREPGPDPRESAVSRQATGLGWAVRCPFCDDGCLDSVRRSFQVYLPSPNPC
ncbi:hypothetical protein G6F32_017216 [Rhizopus arrhizus]|nr:hypothetical protein G6F32_017216 [Rhizopus arrhizus]